jgi:predicted nucleotidyltransferase
MDQGRSLFDLVALTEELSEALGTEVEVLTEGSLSPYLRNAILAKAVAL